MNFNYVMSGCRMCGFNEHNKFSKLVIAEYMKSIPFDFSLLFNAFTEANDGPKYFKQYPYKQLLSDSGGLQITTLGLDKTEVKKKHKEIYKTQAKYSTMAMTFDEMPLKLSHIIGGSQSRLDSSNRFFIRELVQEASTTTTQNIKEQIEVFSRLDSETKIMIIAQGNNIESYKEYIETIINSLSDDELKYIGGIAPSGASNGQGTLNRFDMMYGIKQWSLPDNIKANVHLLGIGSSKALTPFIGSKDYFSFINNLSFDSSSAPRKYRIDGNALNKQKFHKNDSFEVYKKKYQELILKHKDVFYNLTKIADTTFDMDYFIENATYYSSKNINKVWTYRNREDEFAEALSHLLWYLIPMEDVFNVMEDINNNNNDNLAILNNIKTYDDYLYYRPHLIRKYRLTSKKIKYMNSEEDMKNFIDNKKIISELF